MDEIQPPKALVRPLVIDNLPANDTEAGYVGTYHRKLCRKTLVMLASFTFFLAVPIALSQIKPKDHFKEGERLEKQGKVYEAFEEYELAASWDPSNQKYRARLRKTGALASSSALSKGVNQISVAPHEALKWLQKAVRYDSSNSTASQMLATVNKNILSASETGKRAKLALDNGDLSAAKDLATAVQVYREAVPAIDVLQKELDAADSAVAAQQLWERGNADAAIKELIKAETSNPESVFVQRMSDKVRGEIAGALIVKSSELPSSTPKQLIEKLLVAKIALEVYPKSAKAKEMDSELSARLAKALFDQNKSLLAKDTPDTERIALETIRVGAPWTGSSSGLSEQIANAQKLAYPRIKIRLVIPDSESCKNVLPREALTKTIIEALSPVATLDNQAWDLTLTVKNLGCSATVLPKQSVESTNSTYVAGHNQLANPRYVQLQQDLQAAQAELNRAIYNQSINPNFGTGFATGLARGRVNNIEKAMRETPPFITQPVIQQYTYEKFQSYRAYQIEARLQLYSKAVDKQYLTRMPLSQISEGRGEGISGVLPSDNTGARNTEPSVLSMEDYSKQTLDGFDTKLKSHVRELVAGYFATTAMDAKSPSVSRLSAILYLTDLADGTQYEQEKNKLSSFIGSSLLSGQEISGNLLSSITLMVPEQIASGELGDDDTNSAESVLEKTVDGVLAIETDTGKEGSGFFITTGCLVVTNAHVVNGAETIILKTSSRKLFTAQVLLKDDGRDLALLRSNARVCSPLILDDSSKASIGQEVYAIGNPLGLSGTVTRGIISALRQDNNGIHYIQLDASVNPGNSGGPLISRSGRVLGVNTFKVRGFEGLNFAVASDEIKSAFGQLIH